MVYLIGVDHLIQYQGPAPEVLRIAFKEFLVEKAAALGATLIAEEFSEEAVTEVYGTSDATCRTAALEAGVDHRFCDPEENDRNRLGIPSYADIVDAVKAKHGITDTFILDDALRRAVLMETRAIVRSYFPLRERFWFQCIRDRIGETVIFVCGYEHIPSFNDLLSGEGVPCGILNSFWRGDLFSDYAELGL